MLQRDKLIIGTFVKRPNRFLAEVRLQGQENTVLAHVPNTSRLSELTVPGFEVALSHHDSEERKTKYSLRMIKKGIEWFSIDSHLPNDLVEEALRNNVIKEVVNPKTIEREKTFGHSRFDFKLTDTSDQVTFLEVKGVTLEDQLQGYFPGAPTTRGVKHLKELAEAVEAGHRGIIVFVLQFNHAKGMRPNWEIDEVFSKTLCEVFNKGVEVYAYACDVSLKDITIRHRVPIELEDYRQE